MHLWKICFHSVINMTNEIIDGTYTFPIASNKKFSHYPFLCFTKYPVLRKVTENPAKIDDSVIHLFTNGTVRSLSCSTVNPVDFSLSMRQCVHGSNLLQLSLLHFFYLSLFFLKLESLFLILQ